MLFVYPTPQYPRKPLEYVFKGLYLLCMVLHVISISVLIADFYTRLQTSMIDYFTSSTLTVAPNLALVMKDCAYVSKVKLNGITADVTINSDSLPYGLLTTSQYIISLFVVEFLMVINNGICSMNYSKGNRHLRFFGIHVPFYHITIVFTYVYSIAIIVITWVFESNRTFFRDAVRHCAEEQEAADPVALLVAEYDDVNIFTTAVYWPFAVTCFTLLIYFFAAAVLCWNSEDEATLLLSEADAPWEKRGVMCATYKPLLKIHTAQRNGIVEDARKAISEGQQVRIVRSYQLMTEEDFDILVKAMREQVMQALKERQFEKLKENFGDRESQIDEGGLMWRQAMPWKLKEGDRDPSPAEADNFYPDVDQMLYGSGDLYNNNNNQEEMYPLEDLGLDEDDFRDVVEDNGNYNNDNNNNVFYDEDGEQIILQEEPTYDDNRRYHDDYSERGYNDYNNNNNNNNNNMDDEDYFYNGQDNYEPSPVSPTGDEYSPAEEWSNTRRRNNPNNNNNNNYNNSHRRGYDDADYDNGDEMSFDDF